MTVRVCPFRSPLYLLRIFYRFLYGLKIEEPLPIVCVEAL